MVHTDALTNIGFAWPNNPGVRSSGSGCLDTEEVCFIGRTPDVEAVIYPSPAPIQRLRSMQWVVGPNQR